MIYICVKDCTNGQINFKTGRPYVYKIGEAYSYYYSHENKEMNNCIYSDENRTLFNGWVNSHFIDENFIPKYIYEIELIEVDNNFNELFKL